MSVFQLMAREAGRAVHVHDQGRSAAIELLNSLSVSEMSSLVLHLRDMSANRATLNDQIAGALLMVGFQAMLEESIKED